MVYPISFYLQKTGKSWTLSRTSIDNTQLGLQFGRKLTEFASPEPEPTVHWCIV
jgi:hypothetical protein